MRRLVKARSETIVYLLFNLKSITIMRESIKYSVALRPNPMNAEEEPKAYASMQHQKTIVLPKLLNQIFVNNPFFLFFEANATLAPPRPCGSRWRR